MLTSFFLFLGWEGGGGFDCAPEDDFSFEGEADAVEDVAVDTGLGFGFVRGGAEEVA